MRFNNLKINDKNKILLFFIITFLSIVFFLSTTFIVSKIFPELSFFYKMIMHCFILTIFVGLIYIIFLREIFSKLNIIFIILFNFSLLLNIALLGPVMIERSPTYQYLILLKNNKQLSVKQSEDFYKQNYFTSRFAMFQQGGLIKIDKDAIVLTKKGNFIATIMQFLKTIFQIKIYDIK